MIKITHVFFLAIFFTNILSGQTKQELVSKDLLNAISALNNKNYIVSVNYLDRCQKVLGNEIVPRIEELYIDNLKALENPILLDEHLKKFLDVAPKSRKGYVDKEEDLKLNTPKLEELLVELNLESKKTQHTYSTHFGMENLSLRELYTSTIINRPGELESKDKIKVFSDDIKLLSIANNYPANKYFYNIKNDKVFSKIGFNANSFSCGLALIDKTFIDETGKAVFDFNEYDEVTFFHKGIAFLRKDNNWGAININGEIIIPVEFENITLLLNINVIKVENNNKYGFYDLKGNSLTDLVYDKELINENQLLLFSLIEYEKGIIPVKLNGKYGFINSLGETIIKHQFDWANNFFKGLAQVKKRDKWGAINKNGEVIIPFYYNNIVFQEKIIRAVSIKKNNVEASFFNFKGDLILSPGYSLLSTHIKNKVRYRTGNKIQTTVNNTYSYGSNIINDSILLKKKNKFYYFNINTLGVRQADFEKVTVLESGFIKVKNNNKYGLLDFIGNTGLSTTYDEINVVNNSKNELFFKYKKGNKKGVVLWGDNEILNSEYTIKNMLINYLDSEKKGLVRVVKFYFVAENKDKLGVINSKNEIVLPFENQEIINFGENIFRIKKDNKLGLLDCNNNKFILPCEYDSIEYYNGGYYKVGKNNLYGITNINGEIIIPIKNTEIRKIIKLNKGTDVRYYLVTKNDKIGLADMSFNLITPIIYDKITTDSRVGFYFEKGNKVGYIDEKGNEILQSQYKILEVISDNYLIAKNKLKKIGIIDVNEVVKIPFNYEQIGVIDNNTFNVSREYKQGVINLNNTIIIPLIYDIIIAVYNKTNNEHVLVVKRNGKMGVISLLNKELIPLKYDLVEATENDNTFRVQLKGVWSLINID